MRPLSEVKSFLIGGFIFALFVLNVLLGVYGYLLKERFHVDELYSYAHSNSTQGAYLGEHIDSFRYDEKNEVHNKWLDAKIFHDYLTVQPEEQFRYGHIWENLFVVEHPPLYFVLLHTVCSFFPDTFSKWSGAALNFVVWIFLLLMFLKLARLFFSSELIAVLTVALYAYSNAGMGMLLYIRMYLLQTLFAVCLMYETVKMLKENEADNKRLFLIFLYSSLGMLTQYSSLVFSFIAAGTGGVYYAGVKIGTYCLGMQRQWRLVRWYCLRYFRLRGMCC